MIFLFLLIELGNGQLGQIHQVKSSRYREQQYRPGECGFTSGRWCGYEQDPDDDFDWKLNDNYAVINQDEHVKAQYGRIHSPFIYTKDTHCVEFLYRISGGLGQLAVYVVENNLVYENPVWASPNHVSHKWVKVQLALNPTRYKIVFQAKVMGAGEIGLDEIEISDKICSHSPHFLRLGDQEVNEAQPVKINCLAYGSSYWGTEIRLQTWDGEERTTVERAQKDMTEYQSAEFDWKSVKRSDEDRIRCVASNATAAGVSNYARLVVKNQPVPNLAPEVETAGATFLVVRLNVRMGDENHYVGYTGHGPITGMDFYYRKSDSSWEDKHSILLETYNGTYHIWHLEPDTFYEIAIKLARPGDGGMGKMGPPLRVRTKCAIPQPLKGVVADSEGHGQRISQNRYNLSVKWLMPSEKDAGCSNWSYTVKWRVQNGIWSLRELEKTETTCILANLKPYTDYEIIVAVRNVVGTTVVKVDPVRTLDGLPDQIPADSIKQYASETRIVISWPEPMISHGKIIEYRLYYIFDSNYQKLQLEQLNSVTRGEFEREYTITDLTPGSLYNISLSAKTAAGYGRATNLQIRTKIGRPVFNTKLSPAAKFPRSTSMHLTLNKAQSNGAPISRYNVIIQPVVSRVKRNEAKNCFKREVSYYEYIQSRGEYYYAAKLVDGDFGNDLVYEFDVGDGQNYTGFYNAPLEPDLEYKIWFQAVSKEPKCDTSCDISANCHLVASTNGVEIEQLEFTTRFPINTRHTEPRVGPTDADSVLLYGGVATVLLLILFVFVGAIVCIRRRAMFRSSEQYHISTGQTDLYKDDSHMYQEKKPLMPDLVDYPSSSRRSETEDFAVRVEDFPIHVSQMRCSRTYGFSDEFETLPEGGTALWDIAQRTENIQKNRYNNILPYDHSRVILRGSSQIVNNGDYINASWISGYGVRYIAAQGPTDQTIQDFWHCVYQENIRLVIMVTGLVEMGRRKCHQYWPNQVDVPEQFGSFQVELMGEQSQAHYTVRDIRIKLGKEFRIIKQMQYHSWPDHGVPARSTSLLQFVRRSAQLNQDNQPILVHCSAGSGRSGCFIVLDWMLRMADAEGLLDIYNTVKELRHRRVNMVANLEQYIFLHDSLLEAVLCGETGVSSDELSRHYDQLITVSNGTAPIQEEFETLTVLTPRLTTEECQTARLARNRPKNRFMDVLPADRDLPYLITPDPAGSDPSNNYINAVFGDSFLNRRDIIITQMPLPHTVGDFWRLIHDYNVSVIVMLNDKTENDDSTQNYWPENDSQTYGAFTVECLSKDDEIELVSRTLKLTNYYRPSDPSRMVKQLQLTNWPVNQPVPSSRNSVLRLSSLIDQWRSQQDTPTRVLIHCVAGAGRSGTFAGCLCVIQQLKSIQSADVFSSVLQLRAVRPQLVETLDQYRFIYEVAMEYADSQNL